VGKGVRAAMAGPAVNMKSTLTPYLSPTAACALALGTSIGWGSVVVTGNTYISQAGPMGSALGLAIGAIVMITISRNYHYMMNCTPDAGGAYAYSRDTFGYDHGFLAAWFLMLTYFAILWANATSLPLFSRIFIGPVFETGFLYTVFGYDIYLGEILLSVGAIAIFGLFLTRFKKGAANLMVALVAFFTIGITVCFGAAMLGLDIPIEPAFVPDENEFSQILIIACISPWAFIGFESISHGAEEFTFPVSRAFKVLVAAVVTATLLYLFIILLSVSAFPPEYGTSLRYVSVAGHLSGLTGLPPFYAAQHYLGQGGVTLLMLSLFCLIATSFIGNILALSRLFFSLGRDRVVPAFFADLNDKGIPWKAILFTAGVSCLIPFIGRTAIGWIVDVTTLGATIIYAFVSACTWKTARFRGDKLEERTGIAGLAVMVAIALYLLVPNLFTTGSMASETYFLFVAWAILGFIVFRAVLQHERENRFGGSIIVWVGLLSLVLFVSLVWMSQTNMNVTADAVANIQKHYAEAGAVIDDAFVASTLEGIRLANARSIVVVVALFALSLGVLLTNYAVLSKRARRHEAELGKVRHAANTDPLTGVKSKLAFSEYETAADGRIADGSQTPFAIVICDVNGLKYVNDTQGHKAGDDYIRSASLLVCEVFQHSPVFRIGGDEFVAVLTGRDYEHRDELMQKINLRVEENIAYDEVVVSAGLAEYEPGADTTLHAVFERADALMYKRKRELKEMGARTR